MIVYPDIEIQNGKCVSLIRGHMDKPIVFDIAPLEAAKSFATEGAEWIHVVDLDAVAGKEKTNADLIKEIISSVYVPVQVAGGIRSELDIDHWIEAGAGRVVIATGAVRYPQMVINAASRHPGKIVVSIDGSDGYVVCEGWTETTAWTPLEFARQFETSDIAAIIFTDIDKTHDLPESSLATTAELASSLIVPVISSGTVKTLDDIATLYYLPNIAGSIAGWALFNKNFKLSEAIELVHSK